MSCNSCAKPFSLLRKEKGCPRCGFSFCSKCLVNKLYIPKLNAEAKVCAKCKRAPLDNKTNAEQKTVEPPDAYYKRLGLTKNKSIDMPSSTTGNTNLELEIATRLQKLKGDSKPKTTEDEIAQRLKKIKGDMPKVSQDELQERLAKLKGVPVATVQTQPVIIQPDLKTEQEQADDLLKQYLEQTNMDKTYKDEFDTLVGDIESRLGKLKGADGSSGSGQSSKPVDVESEDEEETVKKIVEKVKAEVSLDEDELPLSTDDELPFCEICNEDAKMRCLGCRYLFCKRCFNDHKDDDDGCNRYEPYTPPKVTRY